MMRRGPAQCVWTDVDGAVRLLAPRSTFAKVVEEAFRQIRQHGSQQPAILIRLVESLGQLLALAKEEGLLLGISAGANVWAAIRVAEELGPDANVVTILCDTGERYFSLGEYFQ